MTLTDNTGVMLNIVGLPVTKVMSGEELRLIHHNVTHMETVIKDRIINSTGRLAQLQSVVSTQLRVVKEEITNVEAAVEEQEKKTWILYLCVSLLLIIIIAGVIIAYFCSRRVRRMVDEAYTKMKEHDAIPERVMEQVKAQMMRMEEGLDRMKKHVREASHPNDPCSEMARREPPWTTGVPRRGLDRFKKMWKPKEGEEKRESGEYMAAPEGPEDPVLVDQPRREAPRRDPLAIEAPPRIPAIAFIPGQELVRYQPTDILSPLGEPTVSPYRISTLERTKNKGASHEDSLN
jgi:hypothetical protein